MTDQQGMEPVAPLPATRDETGRFVKGVSGNPAGRPKNTKNYIAEQKRALESAVRENISSEDVKAILKSMVAEALNGNVSAAKVILDKTISNATLEDDTGNGDQGIKIVVENATFGAIQASQPAPIEGKVIDEE